MPSEFNAAEIVLRAYSLSATTTQVILHIDSRDAGRVACTTNICAASAGLDAADAARKF